MGGLPFSAFISCRFTVLSSLKVTVSVLSTTPLLPPQDEEYARQLQDEEYAHQLQFQLDTMSEVQDRGREVTDPLQGEPVADRVSVSMEC